MSLFAAPGAVPRLPAGGAASAASKPKPKPKPTPTPAPAPKTAPAAKGTGASPAAAPAAPGAAFSAEQKTIAKRFKKMTPLQHILERPDSYVGSLENDTQRLYVVDGLDFGSEKGTGAVPLGGADSNGRMVERDVTYSPALFKIIDELIVNAADHRQHGARRIDIALDARAGTLSVRNDGTGIPLAVHPEYNVRVPEFIFSTLLTSTNFDDDERRTVGGRNGVGAKLAAVFSTRFDIELQTGAQRYAQRVENNMSARSEPRLTAAPLRDGRVVGGDYVCITAWPDFARFGGKGASTAGFDADMCALVARRAVDVATCQPEMRVTFNGRRVAARSLAAYAEACLNGGAVFEPLGAEAATGAEAAGAADAEPKRAIVCARLGARWEIGVALSRDDAPHQVSFVNSIATSKGGTHVKHVVEALVKRLVPLVEAKAGKKGPGVKPAQVRSQLHVFVNCLVENPAFESQCKMELTSRAAEFGSACELTDAFVRRVAAKLGLVEHVLRYASYAHEKQVAAAAGPTRGPKRRRLTGLPKLDDANEAGGPRAGECTLFLCEGDSAKALVVAGLGVLGRDLYGVFPLRGKLLNVREATAKQETTNAEVLAVRRILGLELKRVYTEADVRRGALRYGSVMIMCDQDHDGSHIKGLVENFLHYYWPSLLRVPGFVRIFLTPIVRCTPRLRAGAGAGPATIDFFTLPQYEAWRRRRAAAAARGEPVAAFTHKYYKGLGTSTSADARAYFSNLGRHVRTLVHASKEDDDALVLAFSKHMADARKGWIGAVTPNTFLDYARATHTTREFVMRELVLFSEADCKRSIPSLLDGLKPGQRKVLYACFKRNLQESIKVAQLAGYIGEQAAYHHGEASLMGTIITMAQDFVGSNNVNLLVPDGQFGTRLAGGRDASSPRYIFTRLANVARLLFHLHDDALLPQREDDGQRVEPDAYVPVLPLVLVNGAAGIGTGWASDVPQHAPSHVISRLSALIDGAPLSSLRPLRPAYRGFRGTVVEKPPDAPAKGKGKGAPTADAPPPTGGGAAPEAPAPKFMTRGVWEYDAAAAARLHVTELPVGRWTNSFKELVIGLEAGAPDAKPPVPPYVASYTENNTECVVSFTVHLTAAGAAAAKTDGVHKVFKLEKSIKNNLVLYDSHGQIKQYRTTLDILGEFYEARLALYVRRREHLLAEQRALVPRLDATSRFIAAVVAREFDLARPRAEIVADLAAQAYPRIAARRAKRGAEDGAGADADADAEDGASEDGAGPPVPVGGGDAGYEYLLNLPLRALSSERVAQQRAQLDTVRARIAELEATTVQQLWRADLAAVAAQLKIDTLEHALAQRAAPAPAPASASAPKGTKRAAPVVAAAGASATGTAPKRARAGA